MSRSLRRRGFRGPRGTGRMSHYERPGHEWSPHLRIASERSGQAIRALSLVWSVVTEENTIFRWIRDKPRWTDPVSVESLGGPRPLDSGGLAARFGRSLQCLLRPPSPSGRPLPFHPDRPHSSPSDSLVPCSRVAPLPVRFEGVASLRPHTAHSLIPRTVSTRGLRCRSGTLASARHAVCRPGVSGGLSPGRDYPS